MPIVLTAFLVIASDGSQRDYLFAAPILLLAFGAFLCIAYKLQKKKRG